MPGNSSPSSAKLRWSGAREKAAELERQAVEADQLRRAQIYAGIPADAIPEGVPYRRRLAQEPTRDGGNGHRLFLIFAASSVRADANVRTIAAANASSALGVGRGD